jgi:hypothetical protein
LEGTTIADMITKILPQKLQQKFSPESNHNLVYLSKNQMETHLQISLTQTLLMDLFQRIKDTSSNMPTVLDSCLENQELDHLEQRSEYTWKNMMHMIVIKMFHKLLNKFLIEL